ncbi:hypothetical protein [Microbacterium sp. EST19A]|uniref:hypothetical protein n=1 Tax=Microbacterium sp. EST19A TaxID=2862681 RepID=UPI001CC19002|nr:hypothetical protein [Microbacterium sp. EST19A]
MMRTSQVSPPFRLAAAVALALTVLPLSGCLFAQIPTAQPSESVSSGEPEPSEERSDEPTGGTTLTFAEGLDLTSSSSIEWGDGFLTDDGWKTVTPDDGNGGWTYGTIDDTCTARFWQGRIADVPVVAGDDSASSDAILGVLLNTTTADITAVADTGEFSYQVGGHGGGVENRQVIGEDGDRTWLMAARAFTQTGVGLYVIVDCTGADAADTMALVNEANAVVVTP